MCKFGSYFNCVIIMSERCVLVSGAEVREYSRTNSVGPLEVHFADGGRGILSDLRDGGVLAHFCLEDFHMVLVVDLEGNHVGGRGDGVGVLRFLLQDFAGGNESVGCETDKHGSSFVIRLLEWRLCEVGGLLCCMYLIALFRCCLLSVLVVLRVRSVGDGGSKARY